MITRTPSTWRLLSLLVAAATAPAIAVACGGNAETGATSEDGGGDSGRDGKATSEASSNPIATGCGSPSTASKQVDPLLCSAQLASATTCGGSVCAWSVELPCTSDAGAIDSGADAGADARLEEPCVLCNAAKPAGASATTICQTQSVDGSSVLVARCGGCGVGRPPRGFVPRRAAASSLAAERLAEMAQLEAASVVAFNALYDDLKLLGAPGHLLRAVRAAENDEVRHARAMTRAAERFGAVVPETRVLGSRGRSLAQLAIENAEEGCVKETFGAALAAMQAADASDPRVKRMMRRIADDELRHAALSWKLAAWLEPRIDARARARVLEMRRATIATLRAELGDEGEGVASIGLPDARRARAVLDRMSVALESGDLARAA